MSKTDDLCKRSYIGPDGMIHVRPKRKAWRPKYVRTWPEKQCRACGIVKDRYWILTHKLGDGNLENRCTPCKRAGRPEKREFHPHNIADKICNVCGEYRERKDFEVCRQTFDLMEKTCMFCKAKQGKIVSGIRKNS